MTLTEAAAYLKRGRRFVRKQIAARQLRAAIVGERKEIITRREWCDEWVENMSQPIEIGRHRQGSSTSPFQQEGRRANGKS